MVMLEMKNTASEKNSLDRDEKNTPEVMVHELENRAKVLPKIKSREINL